MENKESLSLFLAHEKVDSLEEKEDLNSRCSMLLYNAKSYLSSASDMLLNILL